MNKTIAICAGHSETDPGAVNGKRTEAAIVLDMRKMVSHYLEKAGINYLTDGKAGINQPLNEAIKVAKKAALAVEFHCNAAASKKATGVEVLSAEKHKTIAKEIAAEINAVLDIPLRGEDGWKSEGSGQHSRLGFISSGGGLIVELFFISNDSDLAKWDAKKWLVAKQVAAVLINATKNI